jgi:hypothetical protein
MKYLPVLEELFTSDSVKFLILGVIIAIVIALFLKTRKSLTAALIASAAVYAVCEILSNIRTNFLVEIILVFAGTAALGCSMVFLVSLIIRALRDKKE